MKHKVKKEQIKKKNRKQGLLTPLQEGNRIQTAGARARDPNPASSMPLPLPQRRFQMGFRRRRGRKRPTMLAVPGLLRCHWGCLCGREGLRAAQAPRPQLLMLAMPPARGWSEGRELTVLSSLEELALTSIWGAERGRGPPSPPTQHHPPARPQGQAPKLDKERASSASCRGALF